MAKSSAQLIRGMQARGWSLGQIGRLVGRNDRLIGQIAHGDKPGANLQRDLVRLARATSRVKDRAGYAKSHAAAFEPARRVTAEGTPAKVRKGPVTLPTGQTSVLGRVATGKTLRQRLVSAARQGRQVSFLFRGTFRVYERRAGGGRIVNEVELHGWDARLILQRLDAALAAGGSLRDAVTQLVYVNPTVDEVVRLDGYTLSTAARKRG